MMKWKNTTLLLGFSAYMGFLGGLSWLLNRLFGFPGSVGVFFAGLLLIALISDLRDRKAGS